MAELHVVVTHFSIPGKQYAVTLYVSMNDSLGMEEFKSSQAATQNSCNLSFLKTGE